MASPLVSKKLASHVTKLHAEAAADEHVLHTPLSTCRSHGLQTSLFREKELLGCFSISRRLANEVNSNVALHALQRCRSHQIHFLGCDLDLQARCSDWEGLLEH